MGLVPQTTIDSMSVSCMSSYLSNSIGLRSYHKSENIIDCYDIDSVLQSTCTCHDHHKSSHRTSLHAVTFMLREVDLPVMLIVDLSLARVVQHSPFQFHAFAYAVQVISVLELSFEIVMYRDPN